MKTVKLKHNLEAYGPDTRLAWAMFIPSASNGTLPNANIVEAHGVSSIVQLSTGLFQVNLDVKGQAIFPRAGYIHSGSNNQHEVRVPQFSTTGSYQVQHLSSGSLSNTVDYLTTECIIRVGT
jgi:hypothetical protein